MAKTAFSSLHYLTFLLLYVLTILSNAQTDQRINLGSSLIASESSSSSSWQSPSGDFAFGFRHIDNQNLFLLAIWFNKIPDKTIVWYANGDNPAPKGSKIELTNDGQFTLNDPQGQSIWKAEISSNKADYAMLLDTGNLVLGADNSSSYLWHSFDHPADTLLPSQGLEVDGMLFSRETNRNYSKGRFRLRLVQEGGVVLNTIVLRTETPQGSYYNTSLNRMNSGYKLVFNETGNLYVLGNGNQMNLTSGHISSVRDFYYRATLDFDGIFTQYAHAKAPKNGSNWEKSWFSVWYVPQDICLAMAGDDVQGPCGFNSFCVVDSYGRPTCKCLPGFSLVDPSNEHSGCKQDKVQKCEVEGSNPNEVYDMDSLDSTFWPYSSNYELFPFRHEEECSASCLSDCNCVVAVIKDGYCRKKKLPLSNGRVERNAYGKALVKIPKIDGSSGDKVTRNQDSGKKDQKTLVLVFSILLGGSMFVNLLFIGGISFSFYFVYQKRQKFDMDSSLLETNLRFFTYEELKEATDGFREEVGRGTFGTVYKGVLLTSSSSTSRKIVAVKKLERLAQDSEKEFKTEASAIATTHHKNLVRLLGFCVEGAHRLLVYEFMSNGTLANFAFGISRPDWNKRIQMALGIARGLVYLHEECSTQIIHCDIKPQNILLDDTFTAKISDFGLAKLLMSDQTRTNTAIRGTKGYVAPEWFRSTPVTAKVDVYSYGVLLLEIVCCRRNVEMERENEGEIILTDWVYDCYKSRRIEKVVRNDDDEARTDMKRVERLVMVAIWCIQEDPSLRPSMKKVLQMLEGVVEVSIPPCPSPFTSIC